MSPGTMDHTVRSILQARTLEWVAFLFSRGSSQPREQTQVFCVAGRFFTSWATREDGGGLVTKSCLTLATPWIVSRQAPLSMGFSRQESWNGLPVASPEDLTDTNLPFIKHSVLCLVFYMLFHFLTNCDS